MLQSASFLMSLLQLVPGATTRGGWGLGMWSIVPYTGRDRGQRRAGRTRMKPDHLGNEGVAWFSNQVPGFISEV